jgi:site-specific DNA-cytosine methylase
MVGRKINENGKRDDNNPNLKAIQRLEPNSQGICNTITSVQKDNLILLGGLKDGKLQEGGKTVDYSQGARIYSDKGLSCTISSQGGGQGAKTGLYKVKKRIRRLTPMECFRLQAFPDDFVKPCSDTQLYKQAGNSITVTVIKEIIKNLIPILNDKN